jgi:glycosyltransferase involved in cell wall biosynthesis
MFKNKVSVIIPAFNASKYIGDSIMSILQSTHENIELLIINDGSKDDTGKIVKSFKDKRVCIINNEENEGIVRSLNRGVKIAQGDYIARMDADDISHPNRLKIQLDSLLRNELDILSSRAVTTNKIFKRIIGVELNSDEMKLAFAFFNPVIHPLVFGKAEIFKSNLYDQNYQHAEDYELWSRLILGKIRFQTTNDILLTYRIHDGQISKTKHENQKKIRNFVGLNYIKSTNEAHECKVINRSSSFEDPLNVIENFIKYNFIEVNAISAKFIEKLYIELLLERKINSTTYNLEKIHQIFEKKLAYSSSLRVITRVLKDDSLTNNLMAWRIINRILR